MGWWKSLFHKPTEARLDAEVRFHLEELTRAKIAEGMSPEEARREAVLEFGGAELIKEELRDVHRVGLVDGTIGNLRFAARLMRKSPSFTATVILTLALGIGANSAVFSAINAILLRPLPFPNGDELMLLSQRNLKVKGMPDRSSPLRVEDWNRMNDTFQAITGYYTEDASEMSGEFPEKITEALVAPRFLQVWGIAPEVGRDFNLEEEKVGGPTAALISDRYWRRHFGGDPNMVGKKLRLGDSSVLVVGVLPASFSFPERDVDVWFTIPPESPYARNREATWYRTIGRLKPGVTVAQAQANLSAVQAELGRAYPKSDGDLAVEVQPLKDATVGDARNSLWLLFGAVSLLLLIACTNIVALLLARATQRQHEIAVRFSLGAPRRVLVMQLLTEVFVLALAGAGLGLLLAAGASRIFRALAANLPRVGEIALDWRIVAYSLVCSVAATLACGLLPAFRGTRRGTAESLAQASRTQVSGRNRLQWLLVGVQVALAVTLLSGAGLLVRSFEELGRVSPGFEMNHVLTFHVSASWGETADMPGLTQRIERMLAGLRSAAGVEDAATSAMLPGVPDKYETELRILEGEQDPNRKILAESRFVSPSYFATMKIPLLSGEICRDDFKAVQAMVNRSFANAYLGGEDGAGDHLQLVGSDFIKGAELRGVVGDAREIGLNHEPVPTVYWCLSAPEPDPYYLVRTAGMPMALMRTVREKIHEIEPGRSVFEIAPLTDHLDDAFSENRMRTVLLAFFALTAVALACVGLYGTLSYSVNARRREVGLRLALGAVRGEIVRQFLTLGLGVAAIGCAVGWGLAAMFGHVLAGMLYGVSPTDVTTLAGVTVLVLIVAGVASLAPAMRASRVEPMQVLREE